MTAKFTLNSASNMSNAIAYIGRQNLDSGLEVVVRDIKLGKTMQQLGAIFAAWIKFLSKREGFSEKQIHKEWKRQFLARIYAAGQEGPFENEQIQWIELLILLREKGDWERVKKHADRISLGWASLSQTQAYMDAIQNHYITIGRPLPVPDREWKKHK